MNKRGFSLRSYQKDAVDVAMESDLDHILLVLSTGLGKSYLIAELGRRNLKKHILVFQPNKEILEQNVEKFKLATGKEPSILSASAKKWELGNITFSTIGTAKNRMQEIAKLGIDLIILDEAQEYPVNSDDSVITKLLEEIHFEGKVIGLTATPFVTYKEKIGAGSSKDGTKRYIEFDGYREILTNPVPGIGESFWRDILYNTSPSDSFDKGFLVKPEYRLFPSDALKKASSILKLSRDKQAYTEESIKAFDAYMINFYKAYAEKLKERHQRTIIFVGTIEIAEKLASEIKDGYCVSTRTNAKDRKEILEKFKKNSKKHIVVFNVSVLGRGFDAPNCDAIAFFTPTRSLIRYMQFVGRCLRPNPEDPNKKPFVYDLDLVDQNGDPRSTLKRFGKVEDIYLEKDLTGRWDAYGKIRGETVKLTGYTGQYRVWYENKWNKWKKKKK